jgi:hypothetical protein
MSRVARWMAVQQEVRALGLDLDSEEGRTLAAWLWRALHRAPPARWQTDLAAVAGRAQEIFHTFTTAFEAAYLAEGAPGEKWVRQFLRNRFGFAAEPAVEAVLNRIRDRRLHLLQAFRDKYQGQLFGPQTFQPSRVRGYLRRVAWVESGKVPLAPLRQVAAVADVLDDGTFPGADDDDADEYRERAHKLALFWGKKNGFSRAQRLQGLVGLGLGFASGEPELERRCLQHLEEKFPPWSERREELSLTLGRLLDRMGLLESQLPLTWDWQEREELTREMDRLRVRLDNLHGKMRRHLNRLRPRPGQVQELLAGFVDQKVGTVRFQRLRRERTLLEKRVREGARRLEAAYAGQLSRPIRRLLAAIRRHLSRQPPSPRAHGLSAKARQRRRARMNAWRAAGWGKLRSARQAMHEVFHSPRPGPLRQALLGWLADAQDLYELAILDRHGVVGGLQQRAGWRLDRLLRVGV